jgi:DNA-binding transcriptional MocR family regulator
VTNEGLTVEWRPQIETGDGFVHERITAVLEADIASGELPPDARLPTHRRLAEMLGVGVGTVTRAYIEAEARGLIRARVGRGTFVAGRAEPQAPGAAEGLIDLSRNVPPGASVETFLSDALTALRRRSDLRAHLDYAPPAGFESHRRAGARWLGETANLDGLDWRRLIVTGGAQQAIAISLAAACRPGAAVIVESATFAGIKSVASLFDYKLVGAAMDSEGLTPGALASAASTGARVAYVQPLQNPTGRIMSLDRRRAIVETARRLDLLLVEDDLYAAYATELGRPPLAALAPERTFYVSGLSKSVTPGLRVGYCIPPTGGEWFERCLGALRAVAFGPPGLGGLVGSQWIEDGSARVIIDDHRREFSRRAYAALDILGGAVERPLNAAATHLWLPLGELEAERVAARALRDRVQVTGPTVLIAPDSRASGLRICLGAAQSLDRLKEGLQVLVRALSEQDERALEVV